MGFLNLSGPIVLADSSLYTLLAAFLCLKDLWVEKFLNLTFLTATSFGGGNDSNIYWSISRKYSGKCRCGRFWFLEINAWNRFCVTLSSYWVPELGGSICNWLKANAEIYIFFKMRLLQWVNDRQQCTVIWGYLKSNGILLWAYHPSRNEDVNLQLLCIENKIDPCRSHHKFWNICEIQSTK